MLSIIIPTYNEEKYLANLLKSIKKQYFPDDHEVIIADNNSTDRTRQIAKEYNCIITQGGLPGAGRNLGAKAADGDCLLFLDADVELSSSYFLLDCLDEFEESNYGCATCCVQPLSSSKLDVFGHEAYNWIMRATVNLSPVAPGFCIMVKKEVHEAIGGFDESIKLGEDTDYVRRAAQISEFGILNGHKVPVSVRRLERDGRLNVAMKYILCGLHMSVLGNVKTDIFKYTFGHK